MTDHDVNANDLAVPPTLNDESALFAEMGRFDALEPGQRVHYRTRWANLMAQSSAQELAEMLNRNPLYGRMLLVIGMAYHDSTQDQYIPVVFADGGDVRILTGPWAPDAWTELLDLGWTPGARPGNMAVAHWRHAEGLSSCSVPGCDNVAVDGLCFPHSMTPEKERKMDDLARGALSDAMREVFPR